MKRFLLLAISALGSITSNSQNVGVGTTTPVQTLEVNGAIKIGNSTNNQAGSLRYNNGDIELGNGSSWKSLAPLPSGAIIISKSTDTASIKAAGFTVIKKMDIWDTVYTAIPSSYPGGWTVGFPLTGTQPFLSTSASTEAAIYNKNFIYYGYNGYLYSYSIPSQTWTQLPGLSPLSAGRYNCGVTLVGDYLYITGGVSYSPGTGDVYYSDCAKYNLLTNTWSAVASMPVANAYHATVALGTDIYALDGYSNSSFTPTPRLYRYNTLTNTWSADLVQAGTPRSQFGGSIVGWNNKIVWHSSQLKFYAYDPVAGTNTDLNPSNTISDFLVSDTHLTLAGDKLYMMGSIPDTTGINNPGGLQVVQYVLGLTDNKLTKLGTCSYTGVPYLYQYSSTNNKIYSMNDGVNKDTFIFDPTASQSCNVVVKRQGYWYYMRKN